MAGRHTLGRVESLRTRPFKSSSRQCGSLLLTAKHAKTFSASLTCAGVAGSLAELPALSLEDLLHLVQDCDLLRRTLAVLGSVRRRDNDRFVRDHLDVMPADGNVTI